MLGPINITLEDFRVSPQHGFLPQEYPLRELPNSYYSQWETIARQIPALLARKTIRQRISTLPVLSTSRLQSEREWQRAYLILVFMANAHIWGGDLPCEILPAAISVPLLAASSHLGLPPIATYSATNLWNFAPISPTEPLTMENLVCLHTFTGTEDEAWFYLISVAMEARGGEIIPVALKAMDAVRADNAEVLRDSLLYFAEAIEDIGVLLERMYEKCDPDVFYHQIRPMLAGSKNMTHAGLPKGVFYEEGYGKGEWRQNSGGSNAQSSLIQFFDIVLGVEHGTTGSPRTAGGGRHGFLEVFVLAMSNRDIANKTKEMRNYMPGPHREFLNRMDNIANIREYVMTSASGSEVTDAFNLAVKSLSEFRDKHIKIVARYIITPSRKAPTKTIARLNLAVASTNSGTERKLHGTGGTDLLPFLKQSRDETRETKVA